MLSHACAWAAVKKHWTRNVLLTFKVHADDLVILLTCKLFSLGCGWGPGNLHFKLPGDAYTAGPWITLSRKGIEGDMIFMTLYILA